MADPRTSDASPGPATRASKPWIGPARPGRLPHARREARALAEELGPGSRVLLGEDATEGELESADLGSYGLVYFAAHAIVDEAHAERSAVLLAPRGAGEDGLLQIREIVHLPLDGRVIVLSSCRSASGADLAGEGVLSLVRAFFQAGARAVVGTLWPVRDEDAAAFALNFARGLGRGRSVVAAHAEAGREAIRAGLPVAAWAGSVVFGDGDAVLRPEGSSSVVPGRRFILPLVLVFVAPALLVAVWLRSRRRGGRAPRA